MTVDLAAFRRVTADEYVNSLADATSNGETVGGAEKTAQQFVMRLFKRRGSVPYRPSDGTLFMSLITGGRASSEADVFAAFAAAAADVAASMAGDETEDDDPAERFQAAVLRKLTVGPGFLVMEIEVKNRSGTSTGVRVPLALTIQP